MKLSVYISIIVLSLFASCVETDPVSTIPEIDFKSFDLYIATDSLDNTYLAGLLEFSFIDGDADIGMYGSSIPFDSTDINNFNVILTPFEKLDGRYFEIEIDTSKPLPYYTIFHDTKLDRVGQNKTIKGIIKVEVPYKIIPDYDTIRYDFYIVDRAKNKSNIETTTDIGFKGITLPRAQLKRASQ